MHILSKAGPRGYVRALLSGYLTDNPQYIREKTPLCGVFSLIMGASTHYIGFGALMGPNKQGSGGVAPSMKKEVFLKKYLDRSDTTIQWGPHPTCIEIWAPQIGAPNLVT